MKFSIGRNAIIDALQTTHGIIGTRMALPILLNVLMKVEKEKLWITATDLDVSIRCLVGANVAKAGAGTISGRKLLGIMKELPAEEVEIEMDDKCAMTIKAGSAMFKVVGTAEDDFPPLPDLKGKYTHTIDQGVFKTMLRNVAYSASNDETRYVLNGVFMSFLGDKLTMVATDGRRLALCEHEVELPKEAEMDLIVPTKTIAQLIASLKDEGEMKVISVGNQIAFELGSTTIVSKLIEGTYPNFRQVIPSQCAERIPLEREALLAATRRMALMTSEKANSIKIAFSKNKMKISAGAPDAGEGHETMAIKYSGKDITVAFNPEYLMDPLRHLVSDEIFLELTDDLSPGVVKCDIPFLYVIMPMRAG